MSHGDTSGQDGVPAREEVRQAMIDDCLAGLVKSRDLTATERRIYAELRQRKVDLLIAETNFGDILLAMGQSIVVSRADGRHERVHPDGTHEPIPDTSVRDRPNG